MMGQSMKASNRLALIILAIASLILLFCPLRGQFPNLAMANSLNDVTATDSDNGGQVLIASGSILTLKLEIIPGTGYSWDLFQNDPKRLAPLGAPTFEPIESEKLGAVEYQIFRFKALTPGTNSSKLRYIRRWEKEATPAKIYSLTVHIY